MSNTAEFVVGGVVFLIDATDLPLVSALRWHLFDNRRGHVYAQANLKQVVDGKRQQRKLRLHRFLLGLDFGDSRVADHINGDTRDNRRANLRITTRRVNNVNRSRKHGGPMRTGAGWIVRPRLNGVYEYHGFYQSREEAEQVFRSVIGDDYAR